MSALNASKFMNKTKDLAVPSPIVKELFSTYSAWAIDETDAPQSKGKWCHVFGNAQPIDLEIGIGSGLHFAKYCLKNVNRNLIGLELKYKPLLQSIRRAKNVGTSNGIVIRYHGNLLTQIFAENELSNIFIYFLDPWPKKKHHKNRLVQAEFLKELSYVQRSDSKVYIKTDHPGYFDWIEQHIQDSRYKVIERTRDLFNSPYSHKNIITQFEELWNSKGLNINYLCAENQ